MTAIDRFTRAEREVQRLSREIEAALDATEAWRDLTAVQALIVARMGDSSITISGLTERCYGGSKVTYNARALVERGLIQSAGDPNDARAKRVAITEKGRRLREFTLGLVNADLYFSQERSAA